MAISPPFTGCWRPPTLGRSYMGTGRRELARRVPRIRWQHDEKLAKRLAGCEADLIVARHTHSPMEERRVGAMQVVNLGSVSNPVNPELQATYAILEADNSGHTIMLRRVNYDREAVIRAIEQ